MCDSDDIQCRNLPVLFVKLRRNINEQGLGITHSAKSTMNCVSVSLFKESDIYNYVYKFH